MITLLLTGTRLRARLLSNPSATNVGGNEEATGMATPALSGKTLHDLSRFQKEKYDD